MKKNRDANYDFVQKAPNPPMGSMSYANMPDRPIMVPFSEGASYRDGLMNNPATGVDLLSRVDENGMR